MSLTFRLRVCLIFCLIAICTAMLLQWTYLNRIEEKTQRLSDLTVPVLASMRSVAEIQQDRVAGLTVGASSDQGIIPGATSLLDDLRSIRDATLTIRADAAETAHLAERIRLTEILVNGLVLLIALGPLWFMIELRIMSRLRTLTRHIQQMASGDLSKPLPKSGTDEIGEIFDAVEKSRQIDADLRRSNEELARFSYVAAHDLRAPLRAISNLVEWTIEDFTEELPEEASRNLTLIRSRTNRLAHHLSALLDYARAGQIEGEFGSFSLTEFVDDVRHHFNANDNFTIKIDQDCGPFGAYLTPLQTILINLLSNAAKHHDRDSGTIHVSCERYQNFIEITVADDGPGIARRYQEQIFVLFQTLKSRDEVEGSGLGLALVQKLASSLGGSVSLRSNPDIARGAVFTVRLPNQAVASAPVPHPVNIKDQKKGVAA
ncbi:Phytochrome-like protein cph1 [Phaeobacter italicus]|uniref:histidine kinase n=1 Tax=Phaeobacter italicus TaxID=481446 RepID=A0A0H5D083_9RHOB|nr:HAMP domain-containing sensor histidine kinase [Phaeobacter italicus]CRL10561.1 Phytochrome-like protein cph1 [Phaeobacter italicus]